MALVSVKKSTMKNGNPGRPNPKSNYIILFLADDLLTPPVKDADGVTVSTSIQLKPGKKAIEIYATPSTIKVSDKSSGDPDKKGYIHTLEFEHPGSDPELSAFLNDNVNNNLMAIVVYPYLTADKLLGWPGCPLQLNAEQTDDDKEDTNKLTFSSLYAGDKMVHYKGAFPATDLTSGSGAFNTQGSGSGA
jgi:hypothetical protein